MVSFTAGIENDAAVRRDWLAFRGYHLDQDRNLGPGRGGLSGISPIAVVDYE